MKMIIIDDEILAITLLENLVKDIEGVRIVGKFTSFEDGLKEMKQHKPDAVLLDIEMPGENGIWVAERIHEIDEEIDIVFVTAYDHYALEAFGVHAADYLLKPVDRERLMRTIQRLLKRKSVQVPKKSEQILAANFLGNFVLYNPNGQPIKWRTRKVKELCAYLLHHQQVSVHKDQILEDLWPELSIDKAKGLLHTSMYQLRKELKKQGFEDAIQYIDERYSFSADITSDTLQLLTILDSPSNQKNDTTKVISLYKHDYLYEDQYLWSLGTSLLIKNKMIAYLESAYKLYPGKDILEKLIALEPLKESYRQMLMSSCIQEGRYSEAVSQFKEFEKLLWEEMGEKPIITTKQIVLEYI